MFYEIDVYSGVTSSLAHVEQIEIASIHLNYALIPSKIERPSLTLEDMIVAVPREIFF